MSAVWRRIKRSNKKAAKYRLSLSLEELVLVCCERWQPDKIAIAWMHRRRRYVSKERVWQESASNPLRGIIVWPLPETIEATTTLYRDPVSDQFEDKEWTLLVEEITPKGRHRPIAAVALNVRLFIQDSPDLRSCVRLKLRPLTSHVEQCAMQLSISSLLLKEGDALDDDLQSLCSQKSREVSPIEEEMVDGVPNNTKTEGISKLSKDFESWRETEGEVKVKVKKGNDGEDAHHHLPFEKFQPPRPNGFPPMDIKGTIPLDNQKGIPSIQTKTEVIRSLPETERVIRPLPEVVLGEELLVWAQRITAGYPGMKITDFRRSWRSGLGFCAIIHRYQPELIGNFNQLDFSDSIHGCTNNCRKAFTAAEKLGIPRCMEESELAVMQDRDKIHNFINLLRCRFVPEYFLANSESSSRPVDEIPDEQRRSMYGLTPGEVEIMDEIKNMKKQREEQDAVDYRHIPEIDDRVNCEAITRLDTTTKQRSPIENAQNLPSTSRSPLMTARQLAYPFDSDSDEEENRVITDSDTPKRQPPVRTPSDLNLKMPSGSGSRHDELRRRARQLLNESASPTNVEVPVEDPERGRQLKERARYILDEWQHSSGRAIPISETISAPGSKQQTPAGSNQQTPAGAVPSAGQHLGHRRSSSSTTPISGSNGDLRTLGVVNANVEFYRFNKQQPSSVPRFVATTHDQPILPAFSRVADRLGSSPNILNDSSGQDNRRYGSMRRGELADSIRQITARLSHQYRSASIPRELSEWTESLGRTLNATSTLDSGARHYTPTRKVSNEWEALLDMYDDDKLQQEQTMIANNLASLRVRDEALQSLIARTEMDSDQERELLTEHLDIIAEGDSLVRRQEILNCIENIRRIDSEIRQVQSEIGHQTQPLSMDEDGQGENGKTEEQKREIDRLMERLCALVNKKDEFVQKLIFAESPGEEEAPRDFVRQQPLSASRRFMSWLTS